MVENSHRSSSRRFNLPILCSVFLSTLCCSILRTFETLKIYSVSDISAITEFVGSGVTERQVRSHLSKWLLSQRRKLAATPERLPRFPHS